MQAIGDAFLDSICGGQAWAREDQEQFIRAE